MENNKRKQVISQFAGMSIDMDYILCVPSIHTIYHNEDVIIDYGGSIREKSSGFPEDKINLLIEWISQNSKEIDENHARCGQGEFPLNSIESIKE